MNTAVLVVSLVMSAGFASLVYPAGMLLGWPLLGIRVGSYAAFAVFGWQGYSTWRRHFGEEQPCDVRKAWEHLLRLGGMFAVAAASTALGYAVTMQRTGSDLASYLAASTAGAAGYGLVFWLLMTKADRHQRGRRMLTKEEVRKEAEAIERSIERSGRPKAFYAGHWLPYEASLGHYLVMGATNTGKSKIQQMLMNSVLSTIGKGLDHRAVIFDAASDILGVLAGMGLKDKVVTLSPFDRRGYAWAMSQDIRTRLDCQTFAANVVHIDEHATQKFFERAVRSLLQETLWALIRSGQRWNFREVLLVMRNKKRLKGLLKTTPEGEDVIAMCFGNFETGQNVMATVSTVTDPFLAVAACWHRAEQKGRAVSLKHWLANEYILVLGNSHKARPAVQAINQVIFTQLTQLILDQPESLDRRNWIFLDEVRQAGRLVSLTDFMVEGRKRGACLCLGFQDIEGMIHVHTVHLAKELCGQAHNIAITKLVNPETAELVSKMFGEEELIEPEVSYSYTLGNRTKTVREVLKKRQAVLPAELMSLHMPSPERGLSFYALMPEFSGGFRHTMTGEQVRQMSPKANKDPDQGGLRDIEPRPDHHQELAPLTAADYERFGIKLDEEEDQEAKQEPEATPQPEAEPKQGATKRAGKKKTQGKKLPPDKFRRPKGTDAGPDAGKWIETADLTDMRPTGVHERRRA